MNHPKEIMFLTAGLSGGGAEKITVTLANELSKSCDTSIVCIYPGGVNVQYISDQVNILQANKGRIRSGLGFLIKQLKNKQPDYLVCNKDDVAVLGLLASKIANVRTRVIARVAAKPIYFYEEKEPRRSIQYWLLRYLYNNAYGVVSVSESMKGELNKLYKLKPDRIKVIYNPPGVLGEGDLPKQLPHNKSSLKIVTIGRLAEQKNYHLFIDTIEKLAESLDVEGYIAGTGPMEDELKRYAEIKGVVDRVHFIGFVENPLALLKQCDIFMLTSHYEGLPGSLVHALISGIKIVSANCDHGASEILDYGKYGILVDGYTPEDFVEATKKSMQGPDRRVTEEFNKHLEKFDLQSVTQQWLDYLGEKQ